MSGNNHPAITASQIRAARGILNWSQDELAEKTDLSIATIRKIETGHVSPRGKTNDDIRRAFESAGLEFIEPGGVRQKPGDIRIYQGTEGYMEFFDDVHHTAQTKGGDIIHVTPSEIPYGFLGLEDYQNSYREKLSALKGKTNVKCILSENNTSLWCDSYCSYRLISKHYIDSVPFYVYDDKYAIFLFESDPSPKITVIQSRVVADAFRRQFYSMWEKATPLNKVERPEDNSKKKLVR